MLEGAADREEDEWDRWRHLIAMYYNSKKKKGDSSVTLEQVKPLRKDRKRLERMAKDAKDQWNKMKNATAKRKAKKQRKEE